MLQTKILLFGKNGQIGWELQNILSYRHLVYAFSSRELDLSDLSELKKKIEEVRPNLIINASAYTAVDRAEGEPELANLINAEAPAVMAECAKKIGASFIHYSTDYVFDGKKNTPYTETDLTNPLNVYGKSKMDGEQAISQIGGGYIILRTSWVYSMRGDNFVSKVLAWARQNKTLNIVTDQIGSPTWAPALARITSELIERSKPDMKNYFLSKNGIYHLGGIGSVSRFDFAKMILRLSTIDELGTVLEPSLTSDFPTPAIRPLYTALDCKKFEQTFHLQLPDWEESLKFALVEY